MTITIQNSHNQIVNLSGQADKYQVIQVTGLDPGKAVISSSSIYGVDGTRSNSARLNNRNIVFYLKIEGNAEQNRRELYRKFPDKEPVTVTITTDETYTIQGIVDGIICNIFESKQILQISVLCDDPYFYGNASTEIDSWQGDYHSIPVTNLGEAGAGFEMSITCSGQIDEFNLGIVNSGGTVLGLDYQNLEGTLRINTIEQSIWLIKNRQQIDMIPYLHLGAEFFKLPAGDSELYVSCDDPQASFGAIVTIPTKIGGI